MLYPKDPKVRVERHEKTLKIEWNWGSKGGFVVAGIAFALALVIWFTTVYMADPETGGSPASRIGFVCFICLLTVIPMILMGLTSALNKTMIHADHERFIIRTLPFPWVKSKIVSAKGIQQFFVGVPASSQSVSSKMLYLLDADSHYVALTSVFPSVFGSHQVCHELQDWYGLEDMHVFGHTDLPHVPGPRTR
jgi:hypothetical protein